MSCFALFELERESIGKENAIKRKVLLNHLNQFWPDIDDREMRLTIKRELPQVCFCSRGYFIAQTKDESDYTIGQLDKRIIALAVQKKRIKDAYPEFYAPGQMELFGG